MLRIAVPNKGSLSEPASQMLTEAGYRQRSDHRELVLVDTDNNTEFFFLRPRDIAIYVGSGRLDVGITGADLLLDSAAPARPILELGFGSSGISPASA
jgi:ATP phosphoribosyltransferase